MGWSIWLLENIYIFEHAHELINMNRKLLTRVYNGVLIARDLEKKNWFIATFTPHGTFGKSTTWDEIVMAGRGVQSNLTPYCNEIFFLGLFQRFVRYLVW